MNLTLIADENNEETFKFACWLIEHIQKYIRDSISTYDFSKWDNYINSLSIFWEFSEKWVLKSHSIILGAINNLIIIRSEKYIIISINPNINIPNCNAKFIDICNLINYGNIAMSPYPIFDKAFKFISDNIKTYYKLFLEEMNN